MKKFTVEFCDKNAQRNFLKKKKKMLARFSKSLFYAGPQKYAAFVRDYVILDSKAVSARRNCFKLPTDGGR